MLGIKTGLFKSVREIKHNYNLEIALLELTTMSDMNVLVGSCYRPPNADKTWIENFDNLLNDVCTRHSKIVLAGDFNFPRACWNSNENSTGNNEKSFIKILDDYFLEQLNKFPTRENNILDLVITSIPDKIIINELLKPSDSKILTDHSAILFELTAACSPLQKVNRFVFDYQRANFEGLRAHLQSRNLKVKISDNGDINYDWMNWKNAFLAAVAEFVPVINTKGRKFLPWMNSTILHLIKKKNTLRTRIKRSSSPSDYVKIKYKNLRAKIKHMLRDSRVEYLNKICANRYNNPKRFWSFFKLKSKVSNIPGKVSVKLNDSERINADTNIGIANMFNEYFASIFNTDYHSFSENRVQPYNDITIDDITLSEEEIVAVIKNLDTNKAQGPDNIPARLLKETATEIAPSLCALFNKSLRVGVLPSDWKIANVVPVHKHGEKTYVENYRPISLLCLISKVLERCIFNNIKYRIYEQLNPCQHGFMPGKSCVTQFIEVLDQLGRELDRGKQIDVLYLDMSKAFDKVSHAELIHRLREFGFGGHILQWFGSYLTNRYQQTTVLGATSRPVPVTSGVPQGSILGPLLFLLYENHLPDVVTNSKIATCADDTKIFKTIESSSDASALQDDLTKFEKVSTNINLGLNPSKCKVLRVTRKRNKIVHPYKLHHTILECTDCERDLGILTSSDLTWSKHVEYQCTKATKALGFVRRATLNIKDIAVRRTLYLSLVRSQLCYGSQIWAPQTVTLIKQAERTHRRATKYVLDLPFRCDTIYQQRLLLLDLIPLCYWHEFLDIVLFYKLINGHVSIDTNLLPSTTNNNRRETRSSDIDHLKFSTNRCKTTTYQRSYLNRTTRLWNILPKELTGINISLTQFKSGLYKYYQLAVKNVFDVDDPRTWKSICLSCNKCRNLSCEISCCY